MFQTDLAELADLRNRVLRDEPVSSEEYARVLDSIRRKRIEGAAKKKALPEVNTAALLEDFLKNTV